MKPLTVIGVLLTLAFATSACGSAMTQAQKDRETIERESSADQLFRKGEASASLGDMIRAEQYYVAALKAGGDERQIVQRLIRVCVVDQRYPAALQYAQDYLYRHPSDIEVRFAAGSIFAVIGDTANAQKYLEEVVRARPEWPDAHFALATVLREQGELVERADYHDVQYLRLSPSGPLAERARARLRRSDP